MSTFQEFPISDKLKSSIKLMKFVEPTPVQQKSIPKLLEGHDLIGSAATGTGKTLAFALPIASRLETSKQSALILCPTRELAIQIESVFKQLLKNHSHIKAALIIGGASFGLQIRQLKNKPQIIIATPGRLVDHIGQKTVSLEKVSTLVLDEADRMLDMGFAPQIERIIKNISKQRQTILFSATFPKNIQQLAAQITKNAQRVSVGEASSPAKLIKQSTIETTQITKKDILLDVLNNNPGSILIFARTKQRTDRLHEYLEEYGYSVSKIHGGRSQAQRNSAIHNFKENKARILVATDVAARGIDISHVAHVINYDLPQTAEDYVHRIGRTGRAGAEGNAISFINPEERKHWKIITARSAHLRP